jgi:hypothetical protein
MGSKADFGHPNFDVRSSPESGRSPTRRRCPFCARRGHQLSPLIPKSKATPGRLRNFDLVLVTSPHAGYTSAERPVGSFNRPCEEDA